MSPPNSAIDGSDKNDDWISAFDNFLDNDNENHSDEPLESIHPAPVENPTKETPSPLGVITVAINSTSFEETIKNGQARTGTENKYCGSSNSSIQSEKAPPAKSKVVADSDSAEARAQARSERKRSREKQRRTDVNAQFNALTALLRQIEADDVDDDTDDGPQKKRKLAALLGSMGTGSATNRVDLIARTIVVLEHLRSLNGKRRDEVVELKKKLEETQTALREASKKDMSGDALKPQEKVMMMVPMMVSPDHLQGGCPYPLSYMPQPPGGGVPAPAFCPVPQHPSAPGPAPPTPTPSSSHTMMQHTQMPNGFPSGMPNGAYPTMFAANPYFNHKMAMPPTSAQAPAPVPTNGVPIQAMPHPGMQQNPHGAPMVAPAPSTQPPTPNHGGGNLAHCA
uniref:BHLH domain-containing protein n=1 Tax=Ditylum brightwellii TaxID=49249 RepID=A0A6U3YMN0_9STRA|mmetsp:Transcript_8586/g.12813  ORF Transcript_8586/g.12813 Transcript_8586/m.12813 type:complete len:396 (+) Transcript_8586:66-1253(+)